MQNQLNTSQKNALKLALSQHNLFITGGAGTGKTFLLNQIVNAQIKSGKTVAVTASTGLAALHLEGRTIHSFLGTSNCRNIADLLEEDQKLEKNIILAQEKRIRDCDVLIIDEISMLTGDWLEMAEFQIKRRRNNKASMGGLQVIFSGDFLQLPPVIRKGVDPEPSCVFAFQSKLWSSLRLKSINLTEVFRQNDKQLLDALNHFRYGEFKEKHVAMFDKQVVSVAEELKNNPVFLYPTNKQVSACNDKFMTRLEDPLIEFEAELTPGSMDNKQWQDRFSKFFTVDYKLELKQGAAIIFLSNLDPGAGIVNGTRGVIEKISSTDIQIKIIDSDAKTRVITLDTNTDRFSWALKDASGKKTLAKITQIPLKIAYALTVHKSQGMSIEKLHIALTANFQAGQTYVALSRARTMAGLTLDRPLQKSDIYANPDCVKFHREIESINA